MTLHVALDGVNGVGKTTMVRKLKEYLSTKSYSVNTITSPNINPILSIKRL